MRHAHTLTKKTAEKRAQARDERVRSGEAIRVGVEANHGDGEAPSELTQHRISHACTSTETHNTQARTTETVREASTISQIAFHVARERAAGMREPTTLLGEAVEAVPATR